MADFVGVRSRRPPIRETGLDVYGDPFLGPGDPGAIEDICISVEVPMDEIGGVGGEAGNRIADDWLRRHSLEVVVRKANRAGDVSGCAVGVDTLENSPRLVEKFVDRVDCICGIPRFSFFCDLDRTLDLIDLGG
jgi:hypothetical protein